MTLSSSSPITSLPPSSSSSLLLFSSESYKASISGEDLFNALNEVFLRDPNINEYGILLTDEKEEEPQLKGKKKEGVERDPIDDKDSLVDNENTGDSSDCDAKRTKSNVNSKIDDLNIQDGNQMEMITNFCKEDINVSQRADVRPLFVFLDSEKSGNINQKEKIDEKNILKQVSDMKLPFVIVNHKLAVSQNCLKKLFSYANETLKNHEKKLKDDKIQERNARDILELSRAVLIIQADNYFCWNLRKKVISLWDISEQQKRELLWREIHFLNLVKTKHPKSTETWEHRRWTFKQYICSVKNKNMNQERYDEEIHKMIEKECEVCERAATIYPRNYNAWTHRSFILQHYGYKDCKFLWNERERLNKFLKQHVSDHSCCHYLSQVLHKLFEFYHCSDFVISNNVHSKASNANAASNANVASNANAASEEQSLYSNDKNIGNDRYIEVLLEQFYINQYYLIFFPGHESLWCLRRFLWNLLMEYASHCEISKNTVHRYKLRSHREILDLMEQERVRLTKEGIIKKPDDLYDIHDPVLIKELEFTAQCATDFEMAEFDMQRKFALHYQVSLCDSVLCLISRNTKNTTSLTPLLVQLFSGKSSSLNETIIDEKNLTRTLSELKKAAIHGLGRSWMLEGGKKKIHL